MVSKLIKISLNNKIIKKSKIKINKKKKNRDKKFKCDRNVRKTLAQHTTDAHGKIDKQAITKVSSIIFTF